MVVVVKRSGKVTTTPRNPRDVDPTETTVTVATRKDATTTPQDVDPTVTVPETIVATIAMTEDVISMATTKDVITMATTDDVITISTTEDVTTTVRKRSERRCNCDGGYRTNDRSNYYSMGPGMKHGSDRKPSRGNGGYPDNERNYHSMPPVGERSHRDGCRYCGHDKRSDYYNMATIGPGIWPRTFHHQRRQRPSWVEGTSLLWAVARRTSQQSIIQLEFKYSEKRFYLGPHEHIPILLECNSNTIRLGYILSIYRIAGLLV